MHRINIKAIGLCLIAVAIVIVAAIAYKNSPQRTIPIVFSPKGMIDAIWQRYKDNNLEKTTLRTLDKTKGNITTSEGESYTMLRAVWMDDHPTFDTSWKWTQDNLGQKGGQSHLFSWLFGQTASGKYGILTAQKGQNTASDADTDIALSLAFAYARWRDPKYLQASKDIITDIWKYEVITVNGKPYLAADNVEKNFNAGILVNPSYFAPYAYRIFAEIDPADNWKGLIDTSYDVLAKSMSSDLGGTKSAGLPPDWIEIDRVTGAVRESTSQDTNYGFDALRVPWRIALDWNWYHDPRAKQILTSMVLLQSEWLSHASLYDTYAHDGRPVDTHEAAAMYGGSIGALMALNNTDAKDLYEHKLVSLYDPDLNAWKNTLSYYDDNWAWFGIALYNDELPNLWSTVTQ